MQFFVNLCEARKGVLHMTEKKIKRIYAIYGWILTCLILVTGICFAWSCVSIYQSGDKPFSRESVALAFQKIAIPVYLCIAGILGGGVLSLIFPSPASKVRASVDRKKTLRRLLSRISEEDLEDSLKGHLKKERRLRVWLRLISVAACVIATVISAIYACDPSHYTLENLNGDILRAVLVVCGCFAVALAVCYVAGVLLSDASVRRELNVLASAPKTGGIQKTQQVSRFRPVHLWMIRIVVLVVGVVLVWLGISNGGAEDVLGKAIRICTECIGLG